MKKKLVLHNMVEIIARPQTMHCLNHTRLPVVIINRPQFCKTSAISLIVSLSTTILAFILGDFNFSISPITLYLLHPSAELKHTHTSLCLHYSKKNSWSLFMPEGCRLLISTLAIIPNATYQLFLLSEFFILTQWTNFIKVTTFLRNFIWPIFLFNWSRVDKQYHVSFSV